MPRHALVPSLLALAIAGSFAAGTAAAHSGGPVADNRTAAGRAQNRRVEIEVRASR